MRKYLYGVTAFVLAFAILSVSFLRCASVLPAFGFTTRVVNQTPAPTPIPQINYNLPFPGKILPDNWLWYLKVVRDKLQYFVSTDSLKKAELSLLFSDKRLSASLELFQNKKSDLAESVLSKGENYLTMSFADEEVARAKGINTNDFLVKLATASLKHRQVIEEEIIPLAPEDLKPGVIKAEDPAKAIYKKCLERLTSNGIEAPKDPFNGQ